MPRLVTRPVVVSATLLALTAIPILVALVRLVQIPTGSLPPESLRFAEVPLRHFAHAAAGVLFAVLGPLQFSGVLSRRFGRLHRWSGRIYGVAALVLGFAGLGLLLHFPTVALPVLQITRGLAGAALILAIVLGVRAAIQHRFAAHRAWMIRSYSIGIGSTTIALVALPMMILGHPLTGATSDITFVGGWITTFALGEWVIRRPARKPATGALPRATAASLG
jgi:uncharacterized membrane protein